MALIRVVAPFTGIVTTSSSTGTFCAAYLKMPSNQRGRLIRVNAALVGAASTDAMVTWSLAYLSSDGTGGNSITVVKADPSLAETAQSTAKSGQNGGGGAFSVEPTVSGTIMTTPLYPQYTFNPSVGFVPIAGGGRLGLLFNRNNASTASVTVAGFLEWEE